MGAAEKKTDKSRHASESVKHSSESCKQTSSGKQWDPVIRSTLLSKALERGRARRLDPSIYCFFKVFGDVHTCIEFCIAPRCRKLFLLAYFVIFGQLSFKGL